MRRIILPAIVWIVSVGAAGAQDPSLADLSVHLRLLLLENLPNPLHEAQHNWGQQRSAPRFRDFRWVREQKNDGHWWKVKVSQRFPQGLEVKVHNLRTIDKDRQAFQVSIALPTMVDFEQQVWESGLRFYSGSTRARLRVLIDLDIENTIRLDTSKGLIPDLIFRLQVVKSNVRYENLVVEHIAGVGGTAARWIGEGVHETLKQWRPSLERNLLAKANAAIVKAGDTREVRLSLDKLRLAATR